MKGLDALVNSTFSVTKIYLFHMWIETANQAYKHVVLSPKV